jgi:hypothetical protein
LERRQALKRVRKTKEAEVALKPQPQPQQLEPKKAISFGIRN